ncbi:carbohydrate ABC transporter permease [Parasalinivibrio latis]|uniref:carbohydrate ABC transporter permease n=1 Tax=Parasalinivibrio latis TaxID=2952610 RepID=UPI0030DDEC2A
MKNPMIKRSIITWLLLSPIVISALFPYAIMVFTSVKERGEVFSFPPTWLPSTFQWNNFVEMWEVTQFGPALVNSLVVSSATTILVLILAIPSAYAASQLKFRGQGAYQKYLLITQMLAPIVMVIGLFKMLAWLKMIDSLTGLTLVYAAFFLAFAVWMLQNYFATIPKELEESAWLEGASAFKSLKLVFLPMAKPSIVVAAIFTFINSWNEFIVALVSLRSSDNFTLTLKVFSLVGGRYTVEWHLVMAAAFLATIPVAILFAWIQKYLVQGLGVGSVK